MGYMTNRDLSTQRQRLREIHEAMGALVGEWMGREPLLKAYLSYAPRTCGRAGCHCRGGERHPAWIVRLQKGRVAQNRSVSRETYERLKPLAEAYRRFRAAVRRWRQLAREAEQVLRQLEALRCVDAQATLHEERRDGQRP
jgi:hypothetical protein